MSTEYYERSLKGRNALLRRAMDLLSDCKKMFPDANGATVTIPRPDVAEEKKYEIDCLIFDASVFMANNQ